MPQIDSLPPDAPKAIVAIEKADIAVAEHAAEVTDSRVVKVLGAASDIADQPPLVAISLAIVAIGLVARRPLVAIAGARMLAAHALATGIKTVVKRSVDRTRPHVLAEEGTYLVRKGHERDSRYNSFPSGHTAGAVAIAEAAGRSLPRMAWPLRAWAATMAAIQIPRCAHYPSDIAAGALIGLGSDRAVRLAEKVLTGMLRR
jgi:membrane-associated phospholipid phosphatase